MKTILFIALSLVWISSALADTNPTVANAAINPSPIAGGSNPFASLSFIFANTGSSTISNLDVDGNPDPILLTVTLVNGTYDDVNFGTPEAAIGGSFASFFTWTYNAATATYTGTQNAPITGGDGGDITIAYKATTATTSSTPNNGFNVNLTSNGNAPNGPGTNDITDDQSSSKTYLAAPLPVTLVSFKATREAQTALLTWATTQETNSDHFEIQRSVNGKNWQPIGTVLSNGESTVLRKYTFTDSKVLKGINYYRLKMVDMDETYALSRIESLDFGQVGGERLVLYPNPVHDQILIQADDISQISQVEVIGVNGQVLYQQTRQKSDVDNKIDVKGFRSGIYVVRLTRSDRSVTSVKVIKE